MTKQIEDYPELKEKFFELVLNGVFHSKYSENSVKNLLLKMQSRIDELTEQNKELQELSAYYHCCALSGEMPSDYSVNIIKKKASHEWDDGLSKCVKCGDKDWMADKYCSESKLNKESK